FAWFARLGVQVTAPLDALIVVRVTTARSAPSVSTTASPTLNPATLASVVPSASTLPAVTRVLNDGAEATVRSLPHDPGSAGARRPAVARRRAERRGGGRRTGRQCPAGGRRGVRAGPRHPVDVGELAPVVEESLDEIGAEGAGREPPEALDELRERGHSHRAV